MCGATRYVGGGIWRLGKWWGRAGDGMVLHLCSIVIIPEISIHISGAHDARVLFVRASAGPTLGG